MERNDVPMERERERERERATEIIHVRREKEKGGQSSLGEMFVLEPM